MSTYAQIKQGEQDWRIFSWLPLTESDAVAIVDLVHDGWRIGTIRGSLKRLIKEDSVRRVWDRSQRLYRLTCVMAQGNKRTRFRADYPEYADKPDDVVDAAIRRDEELWHGQGFLN